MNNCNLDDSWIKEHDFHLSLSRVVGIFCIVVRGIFFLFKCLGDQIACVWKGWNITDKEDRHEVVSSDGWVDSFSDQDLNLDGRMIEFLSGKFRSWHRDWNARLWLITMAK